MSADVERKRAQAKSKGSSIGGHSSSSIFKRVLSGTTKSSKNVDEVQTVSESSCQKQRDTKRRGDDIGRALVEMAGINCYFIV